MTLRQRIATEVRERGPIPFSRYMELCLYEPELGYYSRNAKQFGKAGDFYTASDVHAVFGRLLARQFEEMWHVLGMPEKVEVLELGPGRGLFARDVLDRSKKKYPEFFHALRYSFVERSPALREAIRENLAPYFESTKCAFLEEFLDLTATRDLAPSRFNHPVIVFGNEFFDALPVEILSNEGALRIGLNGEQFSETWAPASDRELEYLDRFSIHPEAGERVEVGLLTQEYAHEIGRLLGNGFFVGIDYGYTREELLAGRYHDTIMAYRQHSASSNPYEAPGEQDITAHVNFTAIESALRQNGMCTHKLLTQSQFLMGIGESTEFADAFEDCRLPQEHAKVALQLKHLVTPAGMGERFRVLIASRGIDPAAESTLSGLRFNR